MFHVKVLHWSGSHKLRASKSASDVVSDRGKSLAISTASLHVPSDLTSSSAIE